MADPIELFLRQALAQKRVEDRQIKAALQRLRPVLSDVDRLIRESGALEAGPARERIIRAVSDVVARRVRDSWGIPELASLQAELVPFVAAQMEATRRFVEAAGGTLLNPGAADAAVDVRAMVNSAIVNARPLAEQLSAALPVTVADRVERFVRLGLNDPGVEATFQTAVRVTAENAVEATIRSAVGSVGGQAQQLIYRIETDPAWLGDEFSWTAVLDSRTCPVCVGQEGSTRRRGQPGAYWDGERKIDPHLNCVLGHVPVDAGIIAAGMRGHYTGSVVTLQTLGGRVATVTANHPVLTAAGWKPAKAIQKGDQLVCDGRQGQSGIKPDFYQAPPTAEQLFALVRHQASMMSAAVPSTAMDFHGDGVGMLNGDVEVACVNRQLLLNDETVLAKDLRDPLFVGADSDLAVVDGLSPLDLLLLCMHATASRFVCSSNLQLALLGGELAPLQSLGLALRARRDASFDEPLPDAGARDVEVLGDLVFAEAVSVHGDDLHDVRRGPSAKSDASVQQDAANDLDTDAKGLAEMVHACPGLVEVDQVVSVESEIVSGCHVYDFSTVSGAYFAGGILSHNCRCSVVPKVWYDNPENTRFVEGDKGDQVLPFGTTVEQWLRRNPETAAGILGKKRAERLLNGELSLDRAIREAT